MGLFNIFKRNTAGQASVYQNNSDTSPNSPYAAHSVEKDEQVVIPVGMVLIPSGSFSMGSEDDDDSQPVHRVTLDSFLIDSAPVTQAEYAELTGENPSEFTGDSNRPVENVSWLDAVSYCNARSRRESLEPVYRSKDGSGMECIDLEGLVIDYSRNGYRLPTEAEWEYACRAGTSTKYYWGSYPNGGYAWYFDNSDESTQPVRQKKPNVWGLYDMSGNVCEWCNDIYKKDFYASSPESSPKVPQDKAYPYAARVVRGGSWFNHGGLPLASATRDFRSPDDCLNFVGFRCVRARNVN